MSVVEFNAEASTRKVRVPTLNEAYEVRALRQAYERGAVWPSQFSISPVRAMVAAGY